jgi:hypothetical protein
MTSTWEPYREPVRATLLRTGMIALGIGAVLAARSGGIARWPIATLLALWPALGGHFVELWFLNWLRPRLPRARAVQVIARIATWFVGGVALALAMGLTAKVLVQPGTWRPGGMVHWITIGGLAFIGIELIAHLAMQLSGLGSFYNGRG